MRKPAQDKRFDAENSFNGLDDEEFETHARIKRYGNFTLTDAIVPSYDLKVTPKTGFRREFRRDGSGATPVLSISASREIIFDLFLELARIVGELVDVVLETSHHVKTGSSIRSHMDIHCDKMDIYVLLSLLCEFEELLVNDGCTGIAIVNRKAQIELQFDDHKLLYFFNWHAREEEIFAVLEKYGVPYDQNMWLINEAEHVHQSSDKLIAQFQQLKLEIGADR